MRVKKKKLNFNYKEVPRRDQIILTIIRIGRNILTHEFLIRKEDPPQYPICSVETSVKYLRVDCPVFHVEKINCEVIELSSV